MPSCVSDNVTVKSLVTHYGSGRTLYCDTVTPPANSYKDGVKITFTTDTWVVRRGFKFSFTTTRKYIYFNFLKLNGQLFSFIILECGDYITQPTRISLPKISLDSYSSGYMDCEWIIKAPPKKVISLR